MKNLNYKTFGMCEYNNIVSFNDIFSFGDIVFHKKSKEIGIIIQCHGDNEYRVDMFGNCCSDEIRLATEKDISDFKRKTKIDYSPDAIGNFKH